MLTDVQNPFLGTPLGPLQDCRVPAALFRLPRPCGIADVGAPDRACSAQAAKQRQRSTQVWSNLLDQARSCTCQQPYCTCQRACRTCAASSERAVPYSTIRHREIALSLAMPHCDAPQHTAPPIGVESLDERTIVRVP